MARDRSIALRVRAEVSDAVRGLEQVGRAAGDVGDKSDQAGQKSQTLGQRVAQSARDQRQDWQTVGAALTTYGALVTGVGGMVLNTGIQYNSLRQTATQALTAVTGSTEDAAEQMRRLDQYGQNSWLMRDTLVTAQQQMTGFGISAERVIPYMDALAEATAATGGNNQDFLEMAQIMGQIQSQGRITARELERFGMRGVDAASLIGDAMGMTASQIRDEISTGTFDAQTALDALAAGMVDRYGGASDLVRQTWRGAVDDVTAAFRDLSAVIATPLVDPEGGGLLVDFMNRLSDAMFALRDLPPIMLQAGAGIAGLTGAASLGAGTLLLAIPRYIAFRDSLRALSEIAPGASRAIGGLVGTVGRLAGTAAIIGGVTIALGALAEAAKDPMVPRSMDEIQQGIRDIAAAGTELQNIDLSSVVAELPSFLGMTTIEAENLRDVFDTLLDPSTTDQIADFFGAVMPSYMHDNRAIAQELDEALTEMLNAGGADEAAAIEFLESMGYSAEELAEVLPNASTAMEILGDSSIDAADGISEADVAAAEAEAAFEQMYDAARQTARGIADLGSAFNDEWDLQSVTEHIWEQIAALSDYSTNVDTVRDRLTDMNVPFGSLVDLLDDLDPLTAAQLMDELARADDADFSTAIEGLNLLDEGFDEAAEAEARFRQQAEEPINVDIDDLPARSGHEALVDDIHNTTTYTNVDANVDPANLAVETTQSGWESTTTDTMLNADPTKAMQVFNEETRAWETTTTQTNLDLDPDQSIRVFDRETGRWVRTTTQTMLDLDPSEAARRYGVLTQEWRTTTTTTNLDADDTRARGTVTSLGGWASRYPMRVNVSANTSTAAAQIRSLSGIRVTAHAAVARASGGPVFGPGSETSDSILAALSHNEHVISAREVRGLGGHGAVEQIRAMARAGVRGFAQGGTPAYQYRPSPAPSPAAASGPVTAALAPEDRALLRAVADRPVQVQMGRRTLAEATSVAGEYGRARGQGGAR